MTRTPPLSQRVYQIQQIIPFLLLVVVMCYEVTRHLLFQDAGHPALFAIELLTFGITGPALLWLTLNWIGRQVSAREAAEGEADTRTRMMLEMHHRIKNNLQTITDLLSLEMMRASTRPPDECLRDSLSRIKSIAAAHELLSLDHVGAVEISELAERVALSAHAAMTRPDQTINVQVRGTPIFLPSKSATAFALVINELVSNALEHGLAARRAGHVEITLEQDDAQVCVLVRDDGSGLPHGFSAERSAGLGLRIVRTLIEKDLRGTLQLTCDDGTRAEFSFPIVEGAKA